MFSSICLSRELIEQFDAPNMNKILSYLFLGNYSSGNKLNSTQIQKEKITDIIDLGNNNTIEERVAGVNYHVFDLNDSVDDNLSKFIKPCLDIINKKNAIVLVHCHAGISRSASIVIAYLLSICDGILDYDDAFRFVQSRRTIIGPNRAFVKQLKKYAKLLKPPGSIVEEEEAIDNETVIVLGL
jgi:atypical dual specificity phosphatase